MERSSVTIQKRVEGQVVFNNGQFAEIETYGIDGIETGLFF
jgi:hypothetical protein